MPAPVHVVLVTRSSPAAASRFERALAALRAQTMSTAGLTVVVCGDTEPLRTAVDASGADVAVHAPERVSFAGAVETALPRIPEGRHIWMLDDAAVPEHDALARLTAALERQPSVAIAAPKLVRAGDRRRIESFGVTMTTLGRSIELARGEYDQGQHDHADDQLGADIRGMLVRADVARDLVPDRALLGADEGLDLGVRARLGGRRVTLAPAARVAVWPVGTSSIAQAYRARVAQLHRRLVYAPALLVPVHWILLLPFAVWATVLALLAKRPSRVAPEWMATLTVMVRIVSIARSWRRIRRFRTGGWSQVDPLRLTRTEVREHQQATDERRDAVRSPLHFFSGGGAWATLAAFVVSVAAFIALLTWPAVGGGALLPLRSTVAGLWADAAYGLRPEGVAHVGAADPFGTVIALIGSMWPAAPTYALVLLWLLALPLAVLGAWFAATRVAERPVARLALALAWGAAPPLWDALAGGRPAAVITHLLLPWLLFAGAAAHRSWTTAGAASLLLAGVVACAPSLAPALALLWIAALVVAIVRARRGIARIVWLVLPTLAMFAPLAVEQFVRGTPWALFADPGAVAPFGHGPAWAVAGGMLDPDAWTRALAGFGIDLDVAPWVPLAAVPLALLALAAPATRRPVAALVALFAAALGSITAVADLALRLVTSDGAAVAVWPGTAVSLGWLGLATAAAITIEHLPRRQVTATAVAVVCVVVAILPQLTALHRGDTPLHAGETSTLPAYVSAEARADRAVGTLVLTPVSDGSVRAEVVWGISETLGGASTFAATAPFATREDTALADVAADVISGSATSVTEPLSDMGVSFVLTRETAAPQNAEQRVMTLTAHASMDQRAGFVRVGETPRGVLWRVDGDISERDGLTGGEATTAWLISAGQIAAGTIALLLAIPTARTREFTRMEPRIVGRRREERT